MFEILIHIDSQDIQDKKKKSCLSMFGTFIHIDKQDNQDRKYEFLPTYVRNPVYPVYPCLKSLLLVKRLYSNLEFPKLMSKPTSIPVAFR